MKLIFEKDIPELQGKGFREQWGSRALANRLDKRIRIRTLFISLMGLVLFPPLMILRQHEVLPSLLWVFAIFIGIYLPVRLLCHALWVNPLVKRALEAHA